MANQRITVTVDQANSGGAITVEVRLSSDGTMVTKNRTYIRQAGQYTIDQAMVTDIVMAMRSLVNDHLLRAQLW